MKRRLAQDPESTEINVSPLIDLVFILLIFFIVATSFVNEVGITPKHKDTASSSANLRSLWLLICQLPDNYCRTAQSSDWNRLLPWCAADQPRKNRRFWYGYPRCPGWVGYPGNGSGHAGWCRGRKTKSSCSMKEIAELDWTPVWKVNRCPTCGSKASPWRYWPRLGCFACFPCLNLSGPRSGSSGLPKSPPILLLPHRRQRWKKRWSKSWTFLPPPWKLHPCNC